MNLMCTFLLQHMIESKWPRLTKALLSSDFVFGILTLVLITEQISFTTLVQDHLQSSRTLYLVIMFGVKQQYRQPTFSADGIKDQSRPNYTI